MCCKPFHRSLNPNIIQIAIYPGSKLSSLDYTPYAHTTIQLHDRLNAQRS
ncbi:MAG: hypothetical protein ICV63_02005 [Coleofasciculus sp. Co-bin14]|nr:hypothetical protein [Coleofasciculus sp. Co-bin14]